MRLEELSDGFVKHIRKKMRDKKKVSAESRPPSQAHAGIFNPDVAKKRLPTSPEELDAQL